MSVVAADTFDNFAAAGQGAGESDGGHGGLGPAVDHAHTFHRWKDPCDGFRHLHFERVGSAEACPFLHGVVQGLTNGGMIVPMNRGAPCADKVDEFIAVHGG